MSPPSWIWQICKWSMLFQMLLMEPCPSPDERLALPDPAVDVGDGEGQRAPPAPLLTPVALRVRPAATKGRKGVSRDIVRRLR